MLRASVERWVRAMSDAPNRIRVRQTFFETLDLKFRKGKRGKAQRQRPAPTSNNELARQRFENRTQPEIR
jgi:hypothetical protein